MASKKEVELLRSIAMAASDFIEAEEQRNVHPIGSPEYVKMDHQLGQAWCLMNLAVRDWEKDYGGR